MACSLLPQVCSELPPLDGFHRIKGVSVNEEGMFGGPGKGQRKALRLSSCVY